MTKTKQPVLFDAVVVAAYWFEAGKFWAIGAIGYRDEDDQPVGLETDPHCQSGDRYTRRDVVDTLSELADEFLNPCTPDMTRASSVTTMIEGNVIETRQNENEQERIRSATTPKQK